MTEIKKLLNFIYLQLSGINLRFQPYLIKHSEDNLEQLIFTASVSHNQGEASFDAA